MLGDMRLVLAFVLLAGCLVTPSDPPPYEPDPYDGWTGPTGDPLSGCQSDSECAPNVCARDRACYASASVKTGHVTWTVDGAPASTESCAATPNLTLRFHAPNGESFGFAPVKCKNGSFFVDKFPTIYTTVELGPEDSGIATTASIDRETGEAMVDL